MNNNAKNPSPLLPFKRLEKTQLKNSCNIEKKRELYQNKKERKNKQTKKIILGMLRGLKNIASKGLGFNKTQAGFKST